MPNDKAASEANDALKAKALVLQEHAPKMYDALMIGIGGWLQDVPSECPEHMDMFEFSAEVDDIERSNRKLAERQALWLAKHGALLDRKVAEIEDDLDQSKARAQQSSRPKKRGSDSSRTVDGPPPKRMKAKANTPPVASGTESSAGLSSASVTMASEDSVSDTEDQQSATSDVAQDRTSPQGHPKPKMSNRACTQCKSANVQCKRSAEKPGACIRCRNRKTACSSAQRAPPARDPPRSDPFAGILDGIRGITETVKVAITVFRDDIPKEERQFVADRFREKYFSKPPPRRR